MNTNTYFVQVHVFPFIGLKKKKKKMKAFERAFPKSASANRTVKK